MKRIVSSLLTLLLMLTVSCGRHKGMFVLNGTVQDGTDTIVIAGFDSRFEKTDTIFPKNGSFTWSFRPDTVTTLLLILEDGRVYPVFAQKDVQSQVVIPADTGTYSVSGGYCNDSYHSFSLSTLNDSTLEQTVASVDSFITKDPFSEVIPYLIYDRLVLRHHASQATLEKIIKRMSGNMQDAPYLTLLKSEFKGSLPSNAYVSTLTLTDSAGVRKSFADIGGTSNYTLVYVWASWTGQQGLDGRKQLDSLIVRNKGRRLTVIDVSVDVNQERWKEAIAKDTVNWDSFIDTEGWESKLIKTSNTNRIPCYILFSNAKRVIYRTNSFADIDREMTRTLPNPQAEANRLRDGMKKIK